MLCHAICKEIKCTFLEILLIKQQLNMNILMYIVFAKMTFVLKENALRFYDRNSFCDN